MGWLPVADAPSPGSVLSVIVFSAQVPVTWYTSKLPAVVTPSTYRRSVALLTVTPVGSGARLN
jgi:hypothetical protein